MKKKENTYPIYRKYSGINVWFKILSEKKFIEIKQIGTKKVTTEVVASQYPELLLIQDMITCHENRWEEMKAEDFENLI